MAWLFDEIDDRVVVTDSAPLTLPDGDWSLGFWAWLDGNTGSQSKYMFSWGTYATNPSLNILVYEASHGQANRLETRYRNATSNTTVLPSSTVFGTTHGAWQHYLAVRASGTITVYRNGNEFGSTSIGGSLDVPSDLFLGARGDLESARFFGGRLAEMFKIDRALSDAEIAAMARGVPLSQLRGIYAPSSYYLPMYRDRYAEWSNRLALANNGSVGAAHPPVRMSEAIHQATFIAPEVVPGVGNRRRRLLMAAG